MGIRPGVHHSTVVGLGWPDTNIVLTRGEKLVTLLSLDRVRMDHAPLLFHLPWRISYPALTGVPLPAKIPMQVCEPVDWSRFGPEGADNPDVLEQCYREVETLMQQTLDALVEENPFPLANRIWKLLRRGHRARRRAR